MNFIKKNKNAFIVGLICVILLFLMVFAIYRMFYPSNDSVYGARLENAPKIDNAVIEQIKAEIMNTNLAKEVNYETNVAIMKFFVTVNDNVDLSETQKFADIILELLSNKIIDFYDIEIFLTNENNDDYLAIGYHSKNAEEFSWISNVGESNEE